ncbi:unnamed protein product [Rotaria sp. Silwood1]|nr:unnamed protein product [Rotaria sp. Silwood1]CAF1063276.1 unnamed protein product [Rotaria sp. Silwood1]
MLNHNVHIPIANTHDDDINDPTAPFNELEPFDSLWQALRWRHVRTRVPVCFRKTIRNRYMLANLVYLCYAIAILIIDFNPNVNSSADTSTLDTLCNETPSTSILDQPVCNTPLVNHLFIGMACIHILSAFLYWWAWHDRTWRDVIMIPEYLNHLEAGLYLWSALWYSREDTLGGYYTLAVHKIELAAALVEILASFGWIMSWYMTYIRTLGRGFSLDDPDTISYLSTSISSIIYVIYNIQINIYPEQYGTNFLYTYGDIVYFVGACYYIIAALRDDHWFWFLPFAGQYGVAVGRIHVDTRSLPQFGVPRVLITDLCCRKQKDTTIKVNNQREFDNGNSIVTTYL